MFDPRPLYDAIDPDEPVEEAIFVTTLVDGIEVGHVYPWRLYESGDKKRRLSHAAYEALGKVLKKLNNSDLCYRKYKKNDVIDRVEDGKKAFKEFEYKRMLVEEDAKKRGFEGVGEGCDVTSEGEQPKKRVRFAVGESSKAREVSESESDSDTEGESDSETEEESESESEAKGLVSLRGADIIDAYEREQFAGWKPSEPIVISDDESERRKEVEGVEVLGEELVEIEGRNVKGKGKGPVQYVQQWVRLLVILRLMWRRAEGLLCVACSLTCWL